MSDTNHLQTPQGAPLPVEGDGINYGGIVWFIAILTATTLFCQAVVWGMFGIMEHRVKASEAARTPMAAPVGQLPPAPNLLRDEPANLRDFRQKEDAILHTYTMDKTTGAFTMPIERAKTTVLERGLPTRPAAAGAATATADVKAPAAAGKSTGSTSRTSVASSPATGSQKGGH